MLPQGFPGWPMPAPDGQPGALLPSAPIAGCRAGSDAWSILSPAYKGPAPGDDGRWAFMQLPDSDQGDFYAGLEFRGRVKTRGRLRVDPPRTMGAHNLGMAALRVACLTVCVRQQR